MKEFIVTLWNHEDLDQFYQEMENSGECNNIPHRPVECCNRRKISRNTHYFLSEDEAAALLQDERVRDVSLTTEELGIKAVLISGITNKRDDDFIIGESNWGLDTHINGVNSTADRHYTVANSYDYNTEVFYVDRDIRGSLTENNCFSLFDDTVTNKGKNVDVVIVDGDVDGQHIEFRKNTSKLISDIVRLPKKIVVSGLMFPTGKVLNLTFRDDSYHQSNLTNFYIDEDLDIGPGDTVDSRIMLFSEPVAGNSYARNTDGLTELNLVLKSGSSDLATKVVPKPPILDEGYSYNFHYACPLKTVTSSFFSNPKKDEFLSRGYTGDGLMSSTTLALALGVGDANGFSILKHESAETIDHQIIPAYSDYQNPPNENYVYPFYIIRPEGLNHVALRSDARTPSNNVIERDYIAPDIYCMSGITNSPTLEYTMEFRELVVDLGNGDEISHVTGSTNHTVGTGSRLVHYDWYKHGFPAATLSSNPYEYNPGDNADSNHGSHVAATACGNSQGLASEANIYNINPLDFNRSFNLYFDFIRDFHINKPINPETNRQNPTVVNNSWSFKAALSHISDMTGIVCSGFSKYSGDGFNLIGAENPGITGTLDLQISGKVNAVSHIKGLFDNARVLIGGEFTGVTLNGTGFDVRNLCAIDLRGNDMLRHPVFPETSSSLYFGMGVNGPVETILTDLTAQNFLHHPYNHPSQGTILVGGEFTKKYDNDFSETTVKNIIKFDTTQTLENSIILDPTFITKPLFTSLNGKVKKITKSIGNRGYGAKYCFLGDFTEFNGSPQENLLVTDTSFNKTGFLGQNSFDPPSIVGTVNDFGIPQNNLHATNDLEHSMVIGGNFSEVGGQSFNNICALDSTGGLVSEFNQNFNGTNGEINAIIDGGFSLTTYNYIALGNFTSGNSPGDQYASRYNFRTGVGVIPGLQDQMDDFTIDGVVTKAVRDSIDNNLIHVFGSFSQVQGRDINNGATCSYCTLEDISYAKDNFPPRTYSTEVNKNQRRLEPILNQRTLTGAGNVEAAITTDLDTRSYIAPKNTITFAAGQFSSTEGLTLLGENLPGHSNSMIHLTTNFSQSEKEIANNFGAIDGLHRYTKNVIVPFVLSDMEDAIEDGIIFINSAGNDNRLMVPSGHPNFAQVKGIQPSRNFSLFFETPNTNMINSAGTPQSRGINVGSLSVNIEEIGFANRSIFSNYGPQVHVYAPGEKILGAVNGTTNLNPFNNNSSSYEKKDGTSMATPNVCGLVALYLSKYPDLNQEEILNILQRKSETGKMFGPTEDPAGSDLNVPLNNINLYDSHNIIPKYWDFRELQSFYKVMHPQTVSPARVSSGIIYPKIKNKFYN